MSTKSLEEKHFDVRTMSRYVKKGTLKKSDVESYLKALPNDEENFELTVFDDDGLGFGSEMSDEEVANLPPMSEEDIDKFDFLEDED
jgi:hypothetical protein